MAKISTYPIKTPPVSTDYILGYESAGQARTVKIPISDISLIGHTHTEYSLIGHTHTESEITDLQPYLLNITNEPLGDLSDVSIAGAVANQQIVYNGMSWSAQDMSSAQTGYGEWEYQAVPTSTDPGSKKCGFDSLTLASVTKIYLSVTNRSGTNMSNMLNLFKNGDRIYLQVSTGFTKAVLFNVVGITDNITYFTFDVTYDSEGSGGNFADKDRVSVVRGSIGGILADGSVPLTADWNAGGFSITCANLVSRNGAAPVKHEIYTTYIDSLNYERLAITGNSVSVESAGTGAANIDLKLSPAGNGAVHIATDKLLFRLNGEYIERRAPNTLKFKTGGSTSLALNLNTITVGQWGSGGLSIRGGSAGYGNPNRNGTSLNIEAGLSTGNGAPAGVFLKYATSGVSGVQENPSKTGFILDGTGFVGIGYITPSGKLHITEDNAKPFLIDKSTVAAEAPGAGIGMLRWEAGTNTGTLKLVAYSGTSATGITIIDNVGSGN